MAFEAEVFDQRQVPLEPGTMGQPHEVAVKGLTLLVDRDIVPVDRPCLEAEHPGDCANKARLAAAVAPLEHEQTAAIERKRQALEQAAFATNQSEIVG